MMISKYKWHSRRFWRSWIRHDLKRLYFKLRYGWEMGLGATMLPQTGKGKFVSVYNKSGIIQIIDEVDGRDEIRIVPFQPNHGVMIERWRDGKMYARNHMDIKQFNKNIIYASNVEQLAGQKK